MNVLLNLIAVLASLGLCGCHPVVESSSESGNAAAGRNEISLEMQNYIAAEPGSDTFNRGRRLEDCRANYHQPSEEFRKCTASIPIDGDWGVPPENIEDARKD
ncbi:hypothetical protein [Sphingomonas sp. Leaf4]|uniref:hypothetical protein n=1 Tax=Sphingomonas sp. Leaf4 TaxID=2876553 RepID=UPI001E51B264|nr:hypothetical protein [Sphingomonas sp. Leaf4]